MAGEDDVVGSALGDLRDGIMAYLGNQAAPSSATVQVEFGARSVRGRSRPVNEDHYLVVRLGRHQQTLLSSLNDDAVMRRFDEYGYAMIVADGMGGTGAGETASRLAILMLVHLTRHFGKWNLRVDDKVAREMMDRAKSFYRHVDSAVVQQATGAPADLQTTLTAVFGAGRDLFFAHVGHSRAYLFRDGQLMRLTRDHTVAARVTSVPVAPLVDVSRHSRDLMHMLTDTIGMAGSVGPRIDIERFHLFDRDVVLVCTNGLTDQVDEEGIAGVLGSGLSPDSQCQTLIELASSADKGNGDDVTALVAHYRIPDETSR